MHRSLFILFPYFLLFVTLCSNVNSNIRNQANLSSSSKMKIKFTWHLLRARYELSAQLEIYNLFLTIREVLLLSYFTEGETGLERLAKWPKAKFQVSGRKWICLIQRQCS